MAYDDRWGDEPLPALTPQQTLDLLNDQANRLTAAVTSGLDHRPDKHAYVQGKKKLDKALSDLGIESPFRWSTLDLWEAEAKAEYYRNYYGRRQHIKALADPVRAQLERRIADAEAGVLSASISAANELASATLADPSAVREELRWIENALKSNPSGAIGRSKNLIESTAKVILAATNQPYSESDNVPTLIAKSMDALGLTTTTSSPVHVQKFADTMNVLAELAEKVNQLRNKAGDGHGRATALTGLDLRHGRLAARAALAWCAFMLETHHDQNLPTRSTAT